MSDFFEHLTRKQLVYFALMIPFALAAIGVLWTSLKDGHGASGVWAFVVMAVILVLAGMTISHA